MPSTTSFKVGGIVSVNFPYSDLQGYKRRPGLVLHFDQQDLLLARITTQPASSRAPFEFPRVSGHLSRRGATFENGRGQVRGGPSPAHAGRRHFRIQTNNRLAMLLIAFTMELNDDCHEIPADTLAGGAPRRG